MKKLISFEVELDVGRKVAWRHTDLPNHSQYHGSCSFYHPARYKSIGLLRVDKGPQQPELESLHFDGDVGHHFIPHKGQ